MNLMPFFKPKPPRRPPDPVPTHAPPADASQRIKALWGQDVMAHQAWLARSPSCLTLLDWLNQGWRYIHFLGPEGYRDAVAHMLCRAGRSDLVALGFHFDPPNALHGHAPSDAGTVFCAYSENEAHVAVHWSPDNCPRDELWIDGQGVHPPPNQRYGATEDVGMWVADRYYVSHIAGPDDHPQQTLDLSNFNRIRGLMVYDVLRQQVMTYQPGPAERWTDPRLVCDGEKALLIYPDAASDTPDRRITVSD
jgi:hypothetical protein